VMDRVIFQYGNSLITPESVRPTFEKEAGETKAGPHYIVGGYPRPGAVLTQLPMQFVKEYQQRTGARKIDSQALNSFMADLFMKPRQTN